mgnify:CR=1 FL=1
MDNSPRIVRGSAGTELYIPSKAGELMYSLDGLRQETYQRVGRSILSQGLAVPTGDLTAPLVHAAYCSALKDELGLRNVRQILQDEWLWVFNMNLWTDKGLFVSQDNEVIGRSWPIDVGYSQPLDVSTLERKLQGGKEFEGIRFSEDGSVRFAPNGSYSLGGMSAEKLAKNGFMIAQYGVEGAKLMAEASATFREQPEIFGFDIQEGEESNLRVSALSWLDSRLRFTGYDFFYGDGYVSYACAFPVSNPRMQKI